MIGGKALHPCYHAGGSSEMTGNLFEINRLDCVLCVNSNPDMTNRIVVSCFCGLEIDRRTDWYVMTGAGIAMCCQCARCSSCRIDCASANRRLVSVDGVVLCYNCLHIFGHQVQPKNVIRISKVMRNENNLQSNNQVSAINPVKLFKKPDKPVESCDDPTQFPPPYDGSREKVREMMCPACGEHAAVSTNSYAVPSMARVYHRGCFCCANCSRNLSFGLKMPHRHFQFCNCEPPVLWCTELACIDARMQHHKQLKCHLGFIRPGGRAQMDTGLSDPTEVNKNNL